MSYAIKQTICVVFVAALVLAIPCSSTRAQVTASQANHFSKSSEADTREAEQNPAKLFAGARTLFIWSRTIFVKREVIESALLNRDDFRQSGLVITKNEHDADLMLTVRRSNFTTEYPYDVIDRKTGLVVAGGKVNSLFGTAAGKIARGLTKQLQRARSVAAAKP